MRKPIETIDGYYKVFPNYRDGNRKDGYGIPSLSPMSMGPVEHVQPGLPPSKNLENFHQGNKVFSVDDDGNPTDEFYKARLEFYNDPTPHRHRKEASNGKPVYSVYVDVDGTEHHLSYIESRQFYCNYYERFALQTEAFECLKEMLDQGFNLQICGYDAYGFDGDFRSAKDWDECYTDTRSPFGHEKVLACMLSLPTDDWPWRRRKTFDF